MSGDRARAALIEAGEQLFSRRGFQGPSVREIVLEAGQKNNSALQYHFGDRGGLLRAILKKHGVALKVRRAELFDRLVADDKLDDVYRVGELVMRPYAEFLHGSPDQLAYLCIAAELVGDPDRTFEELELLYDDPLIPRVTRLLVEIVDAPEPLLAERVMVGVWQAMDAVADRARLQLSRNLVRPLLVPTDVFILNLTDMLVGAVQAPVSPNTLSALEKWISSGGSAIKT